ncbi:MAG: ABC transporter substrate-binding protein, partial [Dolichospermum sp.]
FNRLLVWAVLGLFTSFLFSCSIGNFSSKPKLTGSGITTIEFWTMQLQPQFTDYFQDLIRTFESQNPSIKVKWVDVPWSAMENKVLTAVSAKTPPDVVNLNPDFDSQLAGKNAWINLDNTVSSHVRSS